MLVLGIETSCDETGVAVYDTARPGADGLRAHAVYSQIALHAEYGGVVPELASRDHVRKLLPLVRQTLAEAGLEVGDLEGVAYTAGPGLVGALLVGAGDARSLAWALDVPAIGVHHMEGHLLAPLLEDPDLAPPFVALLVSGGHTQLVAVDGIGEYRLLGETLAIKCERALDAAGCNTLVVAGGVGANKRLRARLQDMAAARGGRACYPRPALCTDNGAMIAFAGALRLAAGQHADAAVRVVPRWDMAALPRVT